MHLRGLRKKWEYNLPRAAVFGWNRKQKRNIGVLQLGTPILICSYLKDDKVEILRISPIYYSFCLLPPFPRSSYLCTTIARQPTVSPPNPFARRASVLSRKRTKLTSLTTINFGVFRRTNPCKVGWNRIKNIMEVLLTQCLYFNLCGFIKELRLKTKGFLQFIIVFYNQANLHRGACSSVQMRRLLCAHCGFVAIRHIVPSEKRLGAR